MKSEAQKFNKNIIPPANNDHRIIKGKIDLGGCVPLAIFLFFYSIIPNFFASISGQAPNGVRYPLVGGTR
jgi:hypothetical protein